MKKRRGSEKQGRGDPKSRVIEKVCEEIAKELDQKRDEDERVCPRWLKQWHSVDTYHNGICILDLLL